jgi:hypothetical protein
MKKALIIVAILAVLVLAFMAFITPGWLRSDPVIGCTNPQWENPNGDLEVFQDKEVSPDGVWQCNFASPDGPYDWKRAEEPAPQAPPAIPTEKSAPPPAIPTEKPAAPPADPVDEEPTTPEGINVFELECLEPLFEDPSSPDRITGWVCNEDCGISPAIGSDQDFYVPAGYTLALDTNEVLFYWSREGTITEISSTWYRLTIRTAVTLQTASVQFHQLVEYGKDPCNDGGLCSFNPVAVGFTPLPQ